MYDNYLLKTDIATQIFLNYFRIISCAYDVALHDIIKAFIFVSVSAHITENPDPDLRKEKILNRFTMVFLLIIEVGSQLLIQGCGPFTFKK